jgi:hypothetical protein
VDSRSYPHPDCSELCSRAQVPCTPVVADSGRAAYTARLFHFSEWICISQPVRPKERARPEIWDAVECLLSRAPQPSVDVQRQTLDTKNADRDTDGLILWSVQHAGCASGTSEWLGRRLGGQGDLAARNDLLSASLSSSSLSQVIGFFFEIHTSGLSSLPACTRSAMPRHGRTNAIAESEAYDHAYQKFHFLYPARPKERARRMCSLLALTT